MRAPYHVSSCNLMVVWQINCFKERQYSIRPAGAWLAVQTSLMAGLIRLSALTWWDFYRCGNGEYERTFETEIAGVRLRTPMMAIHTVAAGAVDSAIRWRTLSGTSQLGRIWTSFTSQGGPLTVTDCNVMVGVTARVSFPRCLSNGDLPLDAPVVHQSLPPW